MKRKRILHHILRCEEEETGGIYPNVSKAIQTHIMCQTQHKKSSKDRGHQNSVCTWVLSQGHKPVLIDKGVYNKKKGKKREFTVSSASSAGGGSETGSLY